MENHHVEWVNQLFLWAIYTIAFCMFTRPGISWLLGKPTNPTVVTFAMFVYQRVSGIHHFSQIGHIGFITGLRLRLRHGHLRRRRRLLWGRGQGRRAGRRPGRLGRGKWHEKNHKQTINGNITYIYNLYITCVINMIFYEFLNKRTWISHSKSSRERTVGSHCLSYETHSILIM